MSKEQNQQAAAAGGSAAAATGAVGAGILGKKYLKNRMQHRSAMKAHGERAQYFKDKLDKFKRFEGNSEGGELASARKRTAEFTEKLKDHMANKPQRKKLNKKHIAAAVAAPVAIGAGVGLATKKYKQHKQKQEEMKKKASLNQFMDKYASAGAVSPDDSFWGVGKMTRPNEDVFNFLEQIRKGDGYDDRGGQLKKASLRP